MRFTPKETRKMLCKVPQNCALFGAALVLGALPVFADTRADAVDIVQEFFAALEAEDNDAALAMLTENAMLHAPYNPNGDASAAGIRSFPASAYLVGAIQTYDNLVFAERDYSVADDGTVIWVEAEGRLRVAETGLPYENRYVFKNELADGAIQTITEYTNVATLPRDGVTASAD